MFEVKFKEMSKEKQILEAEEAEVAPVRKNEEKMESFVEETPAIVDATKKRKSNASVPVDKFDWDAFEKMLITATRPKLKRNMTRLSQL